MVLNFIGWFRQLKKAGSASITAAILFPGRHQAAVCELDGFMYVIGGAESWNCLNTVERYNPDNNTWTLVAPMNVARRGAAVAVHAGEPDHKPEF